MKNKLSRVTEKTKHLARTSKSLLSKKLKNRKFWSNGSGESRVRRIQRLVAFGVAVFVVFVLLFLLKGELFPKQKRSKVSTKSTNSVVRKFDTISDRVKPDEAWRFRTSKKVENTAKEIDSFKKTLGTLIKNSQNRKTSDMDSLKRRLASLEKQVQIGAKSMGVVGENKPIERIDINLTAKESKKIDTVDSVIPAGAFAKAILLSGVDAPTSLSASGDPLPVLVRVTDSGTLPRKFKSDLKDCHVIAGGYGDLSSERVYLRLDRLTCTERATGEIVETEIAGFVTGEDGKAGMRGRVVEKASKYLANSAIGGIIGGLSSTLQSQDGAVPYISLTHPKAPSVSDKFQRGFSSGMSSSMDRLSQYYIDRAESLQPVIEVSPGRIIDIIFTAKAEIGSTRVKQEIARKRDSKRKEIARNLAANDRYKQ